MNRTPAQIERFLDANLHRFDLGIQYLGDEPNAVRKPWDSASVRWCLVASWPYEQAAGNSSIPVVYKAVNIGRPDFLADRFYLPSTPRDLHLLEKNGIPVFGIESKHQLRDFDVVGTSISYPVLSMNFVKMLSMSDIPIRWRDRASRIGDYPMVMVGGQGYGAPESLAPVVDCWFLGEVEDEPDNPGIAAVTARISGFKSRGEWSADRLRCYESLAREFSFLYFPRFVDVHYEMQDRSHVGVGPHLSKQVVAYTSRLEGMRLPFSRRYVRDLDNAVPLTDPPLLYGDPALGSGDVEASRGCPAWSIPVDSSVEIAGRGVVPFNTVQRGEFIRAGAHYREIAGVAMHGIKMTTYVCTREGHQIECTPEHEISVVRNSSTLAANIRRVGKRRALDEAPREWLAASQLSRGDYVQYFYGNMSWPTTTVVLQDVSSYEIGRLRKDGSRAVRAYATAFPAHLTPDLGWFLGMVAGDCSVRSNQVEFRIEDRAWPLLDKLIRIAKDLFDLEITYSRSKEGPSGFYCLNSARLVKWLHLNFEISSIADRKRVPASIFGSPRSVVAEYLSALYDANGTHLAPKTPGSVTTLRFATCVEPFARQVVELLRMFGLPAMMRSDVRGVKRDGRPSDRASVRWEIRTVASVDGEYDWLTALDPFKARFLSEHFHAPFSGRSGTRQGLDGLVYMQVTETKPGRLVQVMDVDVPGCRSFNVNGFLVHNCSFCSLSHRSKPYRQRSMDNLVQYAAELQNNMGSVRMAPFSPDFPMYTQRKQLISRLLEQVSDEVDAPTMRVDDFIADPEFILLQVHGGMDSVTLGVEGGSQRSRDLLGKGVADTDIEEAVTRAIRAGIRRIKLYMISNLPGEDEGDIYRVVRLGRKLADIRESMNQPTVQIQFSWTPLMIEANTPLQWFAPSQPSRFLADAWEGLRELKIVPKLGAKGEENKAAFFQLCQRASREVGEALVDAMEEVDQATWGGVPRTFKDLLEQKLIARGFLNGFADCFDERFKSDLFGWEFIDQGISSELLWRAYLQMREFVEQTDSETYDLNFDSSYHGSEWIARCDVACAGKACGACKPDDMRIRKRYLEAAQTERHIDLSQVVKIDQRTQAIRIRARIHRFERHRMVGNDHWRFAVRRAAFRAQATLGTQHAVAKRTIRFASDAIAARDWTCGVDYVEFALTRRATPEQIQQFLDAMNTELDGWLRISDWILHPPHAVTMRADVDLSLFELELDVDLVVALARLRWWNSVDSVPMRMPVVGGYFAPATESVNAHDFVDDLWLIRDGAALKLRMLIRGRPSPYFVYAALMGRPSWLDAAGIAAVRLDAFIDTDRTQLDFLRPACVDCGLGIPINVLDQPYHPHRCPRCLDTDSGHLLTDHVVTVTGKDSVRS